MKKSLLKKPGKEKRKVRGFPLTLKIKIIIISAIVVLPIFIMVSCAAGIMVSNITSGNMDATGQLDIPYEYLIKAESMAEQENIELSYLLTFLADECCFSENGFTDRALDAAVQKAKTTDRANLEPMQEYIYNIYSKYYDDIKVGPIAKGKRVKISKTNKKEPHQTIPETKDGGEPNATPSPKPQPDNYTEILYSYTSYNDFGDERTYGDITKHEGNDLIADAGVPVVSITDGIVEKLGWNEYGGNRVGITTEKGTYFYYAHLQGYREGLKQGDTVKAGEVLGYVGNTGYGPPGTSGKFITHLHLQIGVKLEVQSDSDYTWVNPYNVVKFLDRYRVWLKEN